MNYSSIEKALISAGIQVKRPGTHEGICHTPYCVVQQHGTYPFAATIHQGYTLYLIHIYVPLDRYTALEQMCALVRHALSKTSLRPTGNESAAEILDNYKAHTMSLEYMAMREIQR